MKFVQVIVLVLLVGYAVPSISSEWYVIPDTDWQGDWSRISYDNTGNVNIWIKSVKPAYQVSRFANYQHSINLFVVNCALERLSQPSGVDYDAGGRVLNSWSNPNAGFEPVIPDSTWEAVFKAVCPKRRSGGGQPLKMGK